MKSLITLINNTFAETWHPIFYFETFFPGGPDSELNTKVTRYKSKGHHTTGFKTIEEALNSINNELIPKIKDQGYEPVLELESFSAWDGTGVPADTQLR